MGCILLSLMENKPFPIYQLLDAFEAFSHGEADVKAQHRSLYYFLVGYARKRGNVVRYNMPYETGMHGSHIGSWKTYDSTLKDLAKWGFIDYTPGANRYKVPVIGLTFVNPNDDQLLTYWQSYCISTANPSADLVGTQLVTLKEQLEVERKRAEELERVRQFNEATTAAANAALGRAQLDLAAMTAERDELAKEVTTLKTQPRGLRTPGARRPAQEPADFMAFYEAYPKREKRKEALAAWLKIDEADRAMITARAYEWFKARPDLADPNRRQYIPAPASWLNGKRWTDDNPTPPQQTHQHATGPRNNQHGGYNRQQEPSGRFDVETAVGLARSVAVGVDAAQRAEAAAGRHDGGQASYSNSRPSALSYQGS